MKRIAALLLALTALCAATAHAQTRERSIALEGEAEKVVETFYDSGMGFSFWYDASRFEVDASLSEDSVGVMIVPTDSDQAIYLELMSSGSVGMLPWKYLEMNAEPGTEYKYDATENGDQIIGFRGPAPFGDAFVKGCYVVESDRDFIAAAVTWPLEAEEGWGKRLMALLRTVSLDAPMIKEDFWS